MRGEERLSQTQKLIKATEVHRMVDHEASMFQYLHLISGYDGIDNFVGCISEIAAIILLCCPKEPSRRCPSMGVGCAVSGNAVEQLLYEAANPAPHPSDGPNLM